VGRTPLMRWVDASENLSGLEIELTLAGGDEEEDEDGNDTETEEQPRAGRPVYGTSYLWFSIRTRLIMLQ
jgi:hypothetical protein